ncbi:MAG: hypothetical protein ACJ8DZ_03295, partial [Allosphingosinicella sp.]
MSWRCTSARSDACTAGPAAAAGAWVERLGLSASPRPESRPERRPVDRGEGRGGGGPGDPGEAQLFRLFVSRTARYWGE